MPITMQAFSFWAVVPQLMLTNSDRLETFNSLKWLFK